MRKYVYRKFCVKLQQRNKAAIKIDFFTALLESIIKKKQENLHNFFKVFGHQAIKEKTLNFKNQEWISNKLAN
jgi:hypothetical protein